jgi:hypothetical protein
LEKLARAGVAALVALTPWIALALLPESPSPLPDGSPDNAPIRAQFMMLVASPVLFLLLLAYFTVVSVVTRRWVHRTFRVSLLINLLVAAALGGTVGITGNRGSGFAAVLFLFGSLSLGSCVWWLSSRRLTSDCS